MDQLDDWCAGGLGDVVEDGVLEGFHGLARREASACSAGGRQLSEGAPRSAGGSKGCCGGGSRAPYQGCEHLLAAKGQSAAG